MAEILRKKQKISLKEIRAKLKKADWKESGQTFHDYIIFNKDNASIWYDPVKKEIFNIFTDKIEI